MPPDETAFKLFNPTATEAERSPPGTTSTRMSGAPRPQRERRKPCFSPGKATTGWLPGEYLPAEAGTYHVGRPEPSDATTGHLEAGGGPGYHLSLKIQREVKVETAGTPIVSRTSRRDPIYETTLQAAAAGTGGQSAGQELRHAGGRRDGTFEVVSLDGTTAGIVAADSWTRSPRRAAVANLPTLPRKEKQDNAY